MLRVVNHELHKKYNFFWLKLQKIHFCVLVIEFADKKCYTEIENTVFLLGITAEF